MRRALRGYGAAAAAVAAAAVLVSAQLFVPPIIGLANNGDFGRIMEYAGLRYPPGLTDEQTYFRNIHRSFVLVRPVPSGTGYLSSEAGLALAGRVLGQAFSRDGRLDIRAIGAVHAAVLLAALALLAGSVCGSARARPDARSPDARHHGSYRGRAPAVRWTAAAVLVFFFTDVGYVAPFNSFYSQVASLLFLLLTAGVAAECIARGGARGGWLAAYFASALLLVSAKPQESLLAPFLALLGAVLAAPAEARREPAPRPLWRRPASWAAVALCAFGAWYYAKTPRRAIQDVGLFQTTFLELLPKSPNPAADLDALGLDRGLLRYAGMNAYQKEAPIDDPAFRAAFYDRVRASDLVLFYLRRPARLLDRAERGARQAFQLRTDGLGNFEAPSAPRTMDRRLGAWSSLRRALDRRGLLWVAVLLGGNLALAAAVWIRSRGAGRRPLLAAAIAALCGMAAVEFGVCVFGDSLGDTARHLYAFHAMCDLLIATDLVWAVDAAGRRMSPRESARPAP
jgi:hypothetical protein